ncbi:MAG: hypothetical protein ACE5E3_02625 [Mariprofundus sp.]
MHRIEQLQFDLEEQAEYPKLQTENAFKAYRDLARRSVPGSMMYILLYAWLFYGTTLLNQRPQLALIAATIIVCFHLPALTWV